MCVFFKHSSNKSNWKTPQTHQLPPIHPSGHPPIHHECFPFDLSATGWGSTFNLHFRTSARQKAPGHGLGLFIAAVFSGCRHFCGLGSRSICCSRRADRDPSGQSAAAPPLPLVLLLFIGFILSLWQFFFQMRANCDILSASYFCLYLCTWNQCTV